MKLIGKDLRGETGDRELDQVLEDFRLSVHAWSEAAYSRPRTAALAAVPRKGWRPAAAWTLGCMLAAGSLVGGFYERQHGRELARIAAMQAARQRHLAAVQRARIEDANFMVTVDQDVSQEVPSAMEPLAQLMEGNTDQ
jgi:hypothetical protein